MTSFNSLVDQPPICSPGWFVQHEHEREKQGGGKRKGSEGGRGRRTSGVPVAGAKAGSRTAKPAQKEKGFSIATLAVVKGIKYGGDVVGRTVNVDRHVKRSIAYDVLDSTDDALRTLGL